MKFFIIVSLINFVLGFAIPFFQFSMSTNRSLLFVSLWGLCLLAYRYTQEDKEESAQYLGDSV
ncbi:MAG: hypothetical protein CL674_15635 [Bdellovibrionaceae bacterium]|nr:hypothetical protein [Pseudobdellovibrionaceae bacterium]|tara:strand:+ start:36622 stop:36810 length:189 start_codon:yes stop_codon:yes gene_type:complete